MTGGAEESRLRFSRRGVFFRLTVLGDPSLRKVVPRIQQMFSAERKKGAPKSAFFKS